MLEVERKKSNTLQASVFRLRAGNLPPEPTQCTRDEGISLSRTGVGMEEHLPRAAATSSGRLGTDYTTFMEVVEPSSFVAAGDRLSVYLNSSYRTAPPGETWTSTQKF